MPDIQKRLDLGQTIRAIYSEFLDSGKLEIGYHQFTLYIKKLRREVSSSGVVAKSAVRTSVRVRQEPVPGQPRRFVHDPTPPDNILD